MLTHRIIVSHPLYCEALIPSADRNVYEATYCHFFKKKLARFRPTLGPIRLAGEQNDKSAFYGIILRLFRLSFESFQIKHFQIVGSESRPASMAPGFFIGKSFPSSYPT
jgi:hypothetical protein